MHGASSNWPIADAAGSEGRDEDRPPRRCFVISPIGAPSSPEREHADDVFDFIVRPACERAGYLAHRADHNAAPGKISEQMFEAIFKDDLIIGLLTFHNPNVYFEIAVAQSAARPVILMTLQGEHLPFDLKDDRVIHYDLRPRPLSRGVYVDQLCAAIRELELRPRRRVPFAPDLTPLGHASAGLVLRNRQREMSSEDFFGFLASSKRSLRLMGTAMNALNQRHEFIDVIARIVAAGCRIEVLLLDEANPALPQMLNANSRLSGVQNEIAQSRDRWNALAVSNPLVEVRSVRRGILLQQTSMNESRVCYTPYSYAATTTDSPTFLADHQSALYAAQKREFEALWAANAPEGV